MDFSPDQTAQKSRVLVAPAWWTNPLVPVLFIFPVALWSAATTSSKGYSLWGARKFLSADLVETAILLWLALLIGVVFGSIRLVRRDSPDYQKQEQFVLSPAGIRTLERLAFVLFLVVVAAYVVWIGSAVIQGVRPAHLIAVVTLQPGAISEIKSLARPIGGITTFTQFAPIVAALWTILYRFGLQVRGSYVLVLLGLTLGRTLLYAERLALIEIVVPLVVVLAVTRSTGLRQSRLDQALKMAPLVAIPLLWLLFAIFEYTRSWAFYRGVVDFTYPEFVTQRLLGYYSTAINNSALYNQLTQYEIHAPYFSFPALWDFPLVSWARGVPQLFGRDMNVWWIRALSDYANPEFNNKGTLLVVGADLGVFGGCVYWFTVGLIIGWLFRRLRQGSIVGLVAFSSAYVGLLEIPRIIYWVQGRFVPVLIGIAVLAVVGSRLSRSNAETTGTISHSQTVNDGCPMVAATKPPG